jgi:hypothetical protein
MIISAMQNYMCAIGCVLAQPFCQAPVTLIFRRGADRNPVFAPKVPRWIAACSPKRGRQHTHGSQQRLIGTVGRSSRTSSSGDGSQQVSVQCVCVTSPHANIVFVRCSTLDSRSPLSRTARSAHTSPPDKWPVSCPPMERRLLIRIRGAFPAAPSLQRCRQHALLLPPTPTRGEKGESWAHGKRKGWMHSFILQGAIKGEWEKKWSNNEAVNKVMVPAYLKKLFPSLKQIIDLKFNHPEWHTHKILKIDIFVKTFCWEIITQHFWHITFSA